MKWTVLVLASALALVPCAGIVRATLSGRGEARPGALERLWVLLPVAFLALLVALALRRLV